MTGVSPLLPFLQSLWRRIPASGLLRSSLAPLLWRMVTARGRANLRRTSNPAEVQPGPVVISACLSDLTGIGRAGRLTVKAAEAWGVPMVVHDIPGDRQALDVPHALKPGGVWLAHCNPSDVIALLSQRSERLWASRYRIGYWAYELANLPPEWADAIPFFHEIWTPSSFVAAAVERARGNAATIVRVVPHPVAIDTVPMAAPDGGPLTFLVMFDARSSLARKNPLGAVKAFQRAFTPRDRDVRLRLKIVAAWKDPRGIKSLREAAAGWPNIEFIEEELSDDETQRLVASAGCLVSLHRAEGFGLPIAEAMLAGVPVIATDWSGSTDLTRGASYEVPYRMVPAADAAGRYDRTGQEWADPDIAIAAERMRQVRDDPAGRAAVARRGRERVLHLCGGVSFDGLARFIAPAATSVPLRPRASLATKDGPQ